MAKKNKQPKPVKVSETKILELAGKHDKSPQESRKLNLMVQGLMDSLTQKHKDVAAMQR